MASNPRPRRGFWGGNWRALGWGIGVWERVRREKKWKKKKEKVWEDGGGIAEALFLCLDSGKGKCTDEEKEEEMAFV
ncbi:hypothetical protein TIFTF001_052337 [Ficus carica]|uniref:Uncharacterized protein n=1 Tax=Ficus carica TaxID=3494 RepID=A0AA88EGK0_FICCA|nr:hypothetical protein TIFTF001_052337 [Ficus carica]